MNFLIWIIGYLIVYGLGILAICFEYWAKRNPLTDKFGRFGKYIEFVMFVVSFGLSPWMNVQILTATGYYKGQPHESLGVVIFFGSILLWYAINLWLAISGVKRQQRG